MPTRGQLVISAEKDWVFDALIGSCKKLKAKIENEDHLNHQIDVKSASTMTRFGQRFHILLMEESPSVRIEVYDFSPLPPDKRFIEPLFKELSKLMPVTSNFSIDVVSGIEPIQGISENALSSATGGVSAGSLMVDPNLVKKLEYDVKVLGYDGDVPFGDIDKMVIFPIELGNRIELYKKSVPSINVPIKSIKTIATSSHTKGMFRKEEDLLLEITFDDGGQIRVIKLDIPDKRLNEILGKVNALKALEDKYWAVIDFTNRENGKDVPTRLFHLSPFLATGEKVLWHTAKTGGVFSKHVEWIKVLTNLGCSNMTLRNTDPWQSRFLLWTTSLSLTSGAKHRRIIRIAGLPHKLF